MFVLGLFISLFAAAYGSGEFLVVHSPPSIRFKGNEKLDQSLIKELYSASLGYTIEKSSSWPGMFIEDPFHYPRAIVNVAVEGIRSLGDQKVLRQLPRFPLHTDEDESDTWYALQSRVSQHHPEDNNTLVRVELSHGLDALEQYPVLLNGIKLHLIGPTQGELQLDVEEDRKFLEEIALLHAIIDKIKSKNTEEDFNQDVYWFVVSSLHALTDLHGEDSEQATQARELLTAAINRLANVYSRNYNKLVLVTVTLSDTTHTRRTRSLMEKESEKIMKDRWKVVKYYSSSYPVIFNIILWFGVAFVFSLLAICITIASMDPGRDSIIYRMTSNRMKKDN